MAQDTLAGSRIRERRVLAGLRQAELAQAVGISASYLNLIEHNKRRIGGKLLLDIASRLDVEPSLLSEGAEAALISRLREAAADTPNSDAELASLDEFAGRFPGWARLIVDGHREIRELENTVKGLTDRLAHDPQLAASMHEILSLVTAIKSTADILHESKDLEPEWQARFHRNINEDSTRLADSSQALVKYLDGASEDQTDGSPQTELDAFLVEHTYHFPKIETGERTAIEIANNEKTLGSAASKDMAIRLLQQYETDANAIPLPQLEVLIGECGIDVGVIAQRFGASFSQVFRRLVMLPPSALPTPVGMVSCDAAGTILFRKEIEGFVIPKFSAACPKWPLFQSLNRPTQPVRQTVEIAGRDVLQFDCMAIAEPISAPDFGRNQLYHAFMLILPKADRIETANPVGATCRICARQNCEGRREPSILLDGI